MKYSPEEIIQYAQEEKVKFIRLAFCDIYGKMKNVSIMPFELRKAFTSGIAIDASAITGFGGEIHSDLFLHPDPDTLAELPWRPEDGKVIRMYCHITYPDGRAFENDTRNILIRALEDMKAHGLSFAFGTEMEFYLFKLDENGEPTKIPYDKAGYMDVAPDDKGENIRREICLTLERMGIFPETSHHEEGPGQNEIDFRYSAPLSAADNAMTFRTVVKTIAAGNGLHADFSPKPVSNAPGNGLHINVSVKREGSDENLMPYLIAGILSKISEMTVFLNPEIESYERLGYNKAPRYISWSTENRSQLIRVPAATGEYRRVELRSPDPSTNPYLAYALLIYAGIYGIENKLQAPEAVDVNLFTADKKFLGTLEKLPETRETAQENARNSEFIREHLPEMLINAYCGR